LTVRPIGVGSGTAITHNKTHHAAFVHSFIQEIIQWGLEQVRAIGV